MLVVLILLIGVVLLAAAAGLNRETKKTEQSFHVPSTPSTPKRRSRDEPDSKPRILVDFPPRHNSWGAADLADIQWQGRGTMLEIQGFKITDPLTYKGRAKPAYGSSAVDPSQLNLDLPVAPASRIPELPYWPWYSQLEPGQRFLYLSWLASDRKSLPPTDGYLFIYYYGLERRVLIDNADQALVFAEVFRLRKMHAALSPRRPRGSFQNYSTSYLWYLIASFGASVNLEAMRKVARSTTVWTEDTLLVALSWFAVHSVPLPDWMAYAVASRSPFSQQSVVIRRTEAEFRKLFENKYEETLGEGLVLKESKRESEFSYRPASAVLQTQTVRVPNVLGMKECNRQLSDIWNDCIGALRRFSSIVHKEQPDGVMSAAAWESMPEALRATTEHPLADAVHELMVKNSTDQGEVLATAGDLASLFGTRKSDKMSIGLSRSLGESLEHAGFAIEPDARLSGKSYRWDDCVAVFPLCYSGSPDPGRYGAASCMLRLGVAIAEADGRIDSDELRQIMKQIESGFQLNHHEQRRIEALKAVLLNTGSDIAGLGRKIQASMDAAARREVGRLLVAVAGIDGVITKGELSALRKGYRALGLTAEMLESTIAELAPASSDAPVVVERGSARDEGEPIPPPPSAVGVRLDRARVQKIMDESREVSVLLADAMNLDVEIEVSGDQGAPDSQANVGTAVPSVSMTVSKANSGASAMTAASSDIPARYAAFFHSLVSRAFWPKGDADDLAREHGHMLSGAVEAINDWAFEKVGVPLLYDEENALTIDQQILSEALNP